MAGLCSASTPASPRIRSRLRSRDPQPDRQRVTQPLARRGEPRPHQRQKRLPVVHLRIRCIQDIEPHHRRPHLRRRLERFRRHVEQELRATPTSASPRSDSSSAPAGAAMLSATSACNVTMSRRGRTVASEETANNRRPDEIRQVPHDHVRHAPSTCHQHLFRRRRRAHRVAALRHDRPRRTAPPAGSPTARPPRPRSASARAPPAGRSAAPCPRPPQ